MELTAVGFDLDYTLAVPERERARLLAEAVEAVGAPAISREAYVDAHRRNLTGETRTPIFEEFVDDPDHAGELARTYREAVNEALVPIDGAATLLRSLRGRYRVGLLTNGPAVAQRAKLRTLGWEEAFDAIRISGELPAGKPDRAAFAALLDALDVDAAEAVYVGDEVEADIGGATAAGLTAVQVIDEGATPDPRAAAHLRRVELAEALPDVLESL